MRRKLDRKTVATVAFVLGLLLLVVFRSNPPARLADIWSANTAQTPEDSIYAMLDAARAGDTRAYLDAFAGPVRDQLAQVIKENSAAKFSAYLRSRNTEFQSVAVSVADRSGDAEIKARVEYVYLDRNEVQNLYLRKESSRWKIFKIAGADQLKTMLPFGTAVSD
jgi:hypothetical protein